VRSVPALALIGVLAACGTSADSAREGDKDDASEIVVDHATAELSPDSALLTLTLDGASGGGRPYRASPDTTTGGVVVGRVTVSGAVVGDSAITPTHDLEVCHPFTETHLPSQNGGVGNAVVWLAGVTSGPADTTPRRASLTLDRCQLTPRVQQMATGGTLLVMSRDAMSSRLRFVDVVSESRVRARVELNDAGQLVPSSVVAARPGLVAVLDDLHPWIRAYVVIASHPFVAVTAADGAFRFERVPAGRYTLVVWHEQFGVKSRTIRVTTGVETRVRVESRK